MKKKIKIFDIKFDKSFRNNYQKGVKKILDKGFLTNHLFVKELEKNFSKFTKNKYSVAVNSGTSALELIFRSLDIRGKKVLIASNTFIATAIAVKSAGGTPIPVDIDKFFFSLCPDNLKKKINRNIGAVVIVHIGGLISPNIFKIIKICNEYKVPLVEDCAQAFGSFYKSKSAGSFGIASAFSMQTTKVLTSGEGGISVTNNKKLYDKFISNRFYGFDFKDPLSYVRMGNNLKMSEFVALMALCDLQRVENRIKKRIKLAKRYQQILENSSWRALKPEKNFTSSYYKQIILSPIKREHVEEKFKNDNRALTGGVYYKPLHRQPILGIKNDKLFPNTSYFSDYHFCPPCYPELREKDVYRICKVLLSLKA